MIITPNEYIRRLWAAAAEMRGFMPDDKVRDTCLIALDMSGQPLRRDDVEHVIRWALRGKDPFGFSRKHLDA